MWDVPLHLRVNVDPPTSRDMACSRCEHGWHLLPCGIGGCECADVPVPGVDL